MARARTRRGAQKESSIQDARPDSPSGSIVESLDRAGVLPPDGAAAATKTAYASRLSNSLAALISRTIESADRRFAGILPGRDGRGVEAPALGDRGPKRLDVNFSNSALGLGLGISIKTVNHRDQTKRKSKGTGAGESTGDGELARSSGFYTKNLKRIDEELQAEAVGYHRRQPYAVMIGLIFIPEHAFDDAGPKAPSSFGSFVRYFRSRARRDSHLDDPDRFEAIFVGVYGRTGSERGRVQFFDVCDAPPMTGRPERGLFALDELVRRVISAFDARNTTPFHWEGAPREPTVPERVRELEARVARLETKLDRR